METSYPCSNAQRETSVNTLFHDVASALRASVRPRCRRERSEAIRRVGRIAGPPCRARDDGVELTVQTVPIQGKAYRHG